MAKLPEFKSAEELADFVDTHDLSPYWDELLPVEPDTFRVTRRRQTAVRVPLSRAAADKLRVVAKQQGVAPSELVKKWVAQHLKEKSAAGCVLLVSNSWECAKRCLKEPSVVP